MTTYHSVHCLKHALQALCCAGCIGLMGFSPVMDEVYDERDYQKDLPGSPGACQGDECAEADSDAIADGRLRGADSSYDNNTFGQGQPGLGGGDGGGPGMRKGSIRGEFEGGGDPPTKCELRTRVGDGEGSIECRELDAELGGGTGGDAEGAGGTGGKREVDGTGRGDGAGSDTGDGVGGDGSESEGSGRGADGSQGEGSQGETASHGADESPGKRGNEQEGDQQPTAEQPPDPVEPPPEPPTVEDEVMPEVEPEEEPPSFSQLVQTVLLVLGVVLLVVLLALALRAIMRHMNAKHGDVHHEIEEDIEGAEELMQELQQRTGGRSHDDWAQEMRYEEAIHALLLSALKTTLRHQRDLAAPSITSREILRGAELDTTQHAALETLVRAAELCVFARREGTEAMYKACVQAHTTLRDSLETAMVSSHEEDAQ